MGSRPGLAEYIASFEAANNAPHAMVMLIAGAAYALQALAGVLDERPDERLDGRPQVRPGRPRAKRLSRRRDRSAGEP